jgi:cardiolipin synthase A/B
VVDGVGTGQLPPHWLSRLSAAGVQVRVYAPLGRLGLLIPSRWRRLHRKLCVIDGVLGFCGGINLQDDVTALPDVPLPAPRIDYALCCSGPLVRWMEATLHQLWWRMELARDARRHAFRRAWRSWRAPSPLPPDEVPPWLDVWWHQAGPPAAADPATARLVLRDNVWHRKDIEQAYLFAVRKARERILLAHAYFVPGGRLTAALVDAAARGVRVQVLMQGRYEGFMQYHAARPLYGRLLAAGVELHACTHTDLHAKVAVVDGCWATVGSSNLDPLSLLLAREANVVTTHPQVAATLVRDIEHHIQHSAHPLDAAELRERPLHQRALDHLAFWLMRAAIFVSGQRY